MNRLLAVGVPMLLAVAGKWHFAHASVDALQWLMAPTVQWVSLLTGAPFVFETGVGYVSQQAHYAVVAACSGLNFLVAAFVVVAWVLSSRSRHLPGVLFVSAFLALPLTWLANGLRLALAVSMHQNHVVVPHLSPDEAHRLLGVLVYVGALWAVGAMLSHRRESATTRVAKILGAYWFFALFLPLINGAWKTPGFSTHSLWVMAASLLLLGGVRLPSILSRVKTWRWPEAFRKSRVLSVWGVSRTSLWRTPSLSRPSLPGGATKK